MSKQELVYEQRILPRDGDRALRGELCLIGAGESGSGGSGYKSDWTRGVRVRIYVVKPAVGDTEPHFAFSRYWWSKWAGEEDRCDAEHVYGVLALLKALKEPGSDQLRPAEKAAWQDAAWYFGDQAEERL